MIKEKWTSVHIPNVFTCGMNTMARAEAMNYVIKKAMTTRYSLINLLMEILKIEQRIIRSTREAITTGFLEQNMNHSLLKEIKERFSKWAFEQMLFQF
jgi:hypothetical protein